jgi:large subunit ribosomal protein L18
MSSVDEKKQARLKRKLRIRKKLSGTPERPRLCVFRSAKHIYAQIIDDSKGLTVAAISTLDPAVKVQGKFDSKVAKAVFIGKLLGEKAVNMGIKKVVFDRNGFLYHGRVKAVSDGAREAGLDF